jgi:hypothetical protein
MGLRKAVLSVQANPEEILKCYASGDGALHFVYLRNGVATGRPVTTADAQEYLDSPDGESLKSRGWRVAIVDCVHPVLVANVQRIDAKTLMYEGKPYTYSIDETNIFWQRDRDVIDHALTVQSDRDGEVMNVLNVNIRAAIRHFLNHEAHDWQI